MLCEVSIARASSAWLSELECNLREGHTEIANEKESQAKRRGGERELELTQ